MDGEDSSDMFLPLTFGIEYANGTVTSLMKETFGEAAVEFAAVKVEKNESAVMLIIMIVVIVLVLALLAVVIYCLCNKKSRGYSAVGED